MTTPGDLVSQVAAEIEASLPPRPIGEELFWHEEERTCVTCGAKVEWDADILHWWVRYEAGNPPPGTFQCPDGAMHEVIP